MDTKKEIYAIIVKIAEGNPDWESVVDQLRPLCISLDSNDDENVPNDITYQDIQTDLNAIIDDIWLLAPENQFIEFQQAIDAIRKLFEKLNITEKKSTNIRKNCLI